MADRFRLEVSFGGSVLVVDDWGKTEPLRLGGPRSRDLVAYLNKSPLSVQVAEIEGGLYKLMLRFMQENTQ